VGVRFTASSRNTVVIGNTFLQDKDAGLWAVRGGAYSRGGMISVRENHFTADGSGVVAGNVGLLVERNEFAYARDAAIHLIGAGAVIRGNRIQGGATMGIVAENAGEAVIDSNELEQFATYAIMVRGSGNALVRANRIHNCGYGLAFVLGDPRRPQHLVVPEDRRIAEHVDAVELRLDDGVSDRAARPARIAEHERQAIAAVVDAVGAHQGISRAAHHDGTGGEVLELVAFDDHFTGVLRV